MQRLGFLYQILALVLMSYHSLSFSQSVDELIQSLPIDQKIEQMMIFGFAGTDYNTSLGPRLRSLRPGAFIVFGRNIKTPLALAQTISQAQTEAMSQSGLPLLFMVDQEGGQVSRIKTQPLSPSALAMGNTGNQELIQNIGLTTGKLLTSIGINMNLAPVLDVANPAEKHFIGNRAFSGDPRAVANHGVSYSTGLIKANVIPTAKHFPGHGGTRQDSHKVKAKKLDSLKTLMTKDLLPFAEYSKINGIKAMMVAHVAYPALDPSGLPATFSKPIITDLLRDQLGYNGIVITDDLEMSGASGVGDVGERAVRAVSAGVDIIILAFILKNQRMVKSALLEAIRKGAITEDRINDSLRRILSAKVQLRDQKPNLGPPNIIEIRKHLSRLKELSLMVSRENFEQSKKAFREDFKFPKQSSEVAVFTASKPFYNSFKKVKSKSVTYRNLRSFGTEQITRFFAKNPETLGVYYATGNITARRVSALPRAVKSRMIVVNTTFAGMISGRNEFAAVIDMNTQTAVSGFWLAKYLFEENRPIRLPSNEKGKAVKKADNKKRKIVRHEK